LGRKISFPLRFEAKIANLMFLLLVSLDLSPQVETSFDGLARLLWHGWVSMQLLDERTVMNRFKFRMYKEGLLTLVLGAVILSAMFVEAGDRSRTGKVTVIGIDALGKVVGVDLPADHYQQSLSAGLSAVNTSIRPALNEKVLQIKESSPKSWSLRTIGVGVGLKGEIGLGPIFSISLSPRLRLIFTNSVDPIYPL